MADDEAVDDMDAMITLTGAEQDERGTETSGRSADGAPDLVVTDNREVGAYEATVDGRTAAGLVYNRSGDHITLLATSVLPEFRGKGVAARLMNEVLADLRRQGMQVTATCPFARAFVDSRTAGRE